jgi:ankyrin repeat protein
MNDLISKDDESVRSLLDYCAKNWSDHFGAVVAPEDDIVHWVWKLYDVETDLFRLWFPTFWKIAMPSYENPKMTALHLAAFNGHQDILFLVLGSKTAAIEEVDSSKSNALQWACVRGHVGIVERLLEKGANVNAQGGFHGNALYAAAEQGHIDIVQRLLEKGADVNAQGEFYGNALQAAAKGGHLEIIQRLLEKGADVNAQGGRYGTALQALLKGDMLIS